MLISPAVRDSPICVLIPLLIIINMCRAVRAEASLQRPEYASLGGMVMNPYNNLGLNSSDTDQTIMAAIRCLLRHCKTVEHMESVLVMTTMIAAMRETSAVLTAFLSEAKKVSPCWFPSRSGITYICVFV